MNKWQAAVLVFLLSLSIRFLSLNEMGRTWDEPAYVELGYNYIELIKKFDFTNEFWYTQSDHPPFIRYVYGFFQSLDSNNSVENGVTVFPYNYTLPRIISAITGSLTIFFIVFIGFKYFSPASGILAGLIFGLLPFFVGLSQIATLESFVMLSFTATVYFFIEYLTTNRKKYIIFTGISLGISLLIKQSSLIIFPLIVLILFIWFKFNKNKLNLFKRSEELFLIWVISVVTIFLLWPHPFIDFKQFWDVQQTMWIDRVKLPPPEVFFGRLMLVPWPYYFVMFLITTPFAILVLGAIGMIAIDRKRNFIGISVLVWFLFSFLQTFYPFKQHGVRYIIQIYAPFALLAAIGLEYYLRNFVKKRKLFLPISSFLILYLLIILFMQKPYYLDYFNEVVGGTKYVSDHKLFQIGWWGQGIGEAAEYISKEADKKVTVAVNGGQPAIVMPTFYNIKTVYYDKNKLTDYVILPYFDVVRIGFLEQELYENYYVDHIVYANGAKLVKIYKRKTQ